MKKLLLFIAILISTMGLFAQNVGDETIIDYDGYSLTFTVTSIEPAECEVYCSTKPTTSIGITIPSSVIIEGTEFSVTSIGNYAFYSCDNLTSITVEDGNPVYDSRNNCNAIIETETNTLIAGCQNTLIPNSVTSIGGYAFFDCDNLTNIELPSGVTSIGNFAFANCGNLTNIELPSSVTSIGYEAFWYCSSLTSIYCYAESVPGTVGSAFDGCPSDMIIYVPAHSLEAYKAVSPWEQYNINPLYEFEDGDDKYICNENYSLKYTITSYEPAECEVVCCKSPTSPTSPTEITIPSTVMINGEEYSVTGIGKEAFYECENLISIEMPSSIVHIGEFAFYGCSGLTSFEIPSAVTCIKEYTFANCSNMTSIEIPNSVTSIGNLALAGTGLTSIVFPNGVTSIGTHVINNCPNIESVEISSS